ncbi:MAG: DUF2817 domain-containing protein, partial [Planctomycetales bacterium]|nr:DUF2817 domain-containing protein [Planctomycetales bacterium]
MSEVDFSLTYDEARRSFREAAAAAGASLDVYPIDAQDAEPLTIDVAAVGPDDASAIVTSSGVHGVEGFLGSAVQHALLRRLREADAPPGVRHVLIHGVNPFGFAQLRRFNEDNVDLNRNFLDDAADYRGAPPAYARLNGFLNPASPPSRLEPFAIQALWHMLRLGRQAMKQAVAGGQYEFPRGIFFGGHGPCKSTRIVFDNCDAWIGRSTRIVHLDFHSGLGRFGEYKLLLAESARAATFPWYVATFGAEHVEPIDAPGATAYDASGGFGEWMQRRFRDRDYHFAAVEFGTYNVARVLAAIRAENRAQHYTDKDSPRRRQAKAELLECFCPRDPRWR